MDCAPITVDLRAQEKTHLVFHRLSKVKDWGGGRTARCPDVALPMTTQTASTIAGEDIKDGVPNDNKGVEASRMQVGVCRVEGR